MQELLITNIQRMSFHDGPGMRTTVFLKGCNLRCAWCHNPETQNPQPELIFRAQRCVRCGTCVHSCASGARTMGPEGPVRDTARCVGCGRCIAACNQDCIKPGYDAAADVLNCKIAEYTKAVVDGRPSFHISLAMDISPNCDCHPENDTPIVNDIGMFASFDPVAIDQACADAVMASEPLPNTELTDSAAKMEHNHEHLEGEQAKDPFCITHPDTDWRVCIAHAEKIGLGTSKYELIEVK